MKLASWKSPYFSFIYLLMRNECLKQEKKEKEHCEKICAHIDKNEMVTRGAYLRSRSACSREAHCSPGISPRNFITTRLPSIFFPVAGCQQRNMKVTPTFLTVRRASSNSSRIGDIFRYERLPRARMSSLIAGDTGLVIRLKLVHIN